MTTNEKRVARFDDLAEGQLKEVKVGDTDVLLARVGETVHAVGAVCPHYQAPMAKGLLCGTRLYCPWHHSCFDIASGSLLDPPSIDGLPTYPVRVEAGDVFVTMPDPKTPDVPGKLESLLSGDERTMVVLGGGAAGLMAAQTLRQQGFGGRLVMLTRDEELPYDRPKLSKNYLDGRADAAKVPLRKESFYEQYRIEVQVNQPVTSVDADAHTLTLDDGTVMHYDKLLVATGSVPNQLDVPGADLPGCHTLRSFADAQQVVAQLEAASRVVVVGASFIGLEIAASLRKRKIDVTVVTPETVPFAKLLGPDIGAMFRKLHEDNGVTFRLEAGVAALEGDGEVETVVLENGNRLPADLVLVGIGVKPETKALASLNLAEKDKSVLVDTYLMAAPDLFSAGDIARFPDPAEADKPVRIEHWRLAQQHGMTAARNMLDESRSVDELVPFFWTNQYEKRLSYVGHAEDWDDIIIDGNVSKQDFMALYIKGDRVLAAASMNRDPASMAIEELMHRGAMPTATEVRQQLPDFVQLAKRPTQG